MTGGPPPTTAEILHRAAQAPPEPVSVRGDVDSSAEYGSAGRPALLIGGREIPPREPVRRSAAWEYELDATLARARENDLWFCEYMVRHDYEGQLARARAKQAAGRVSRSAPDRPEESADYWTGREITRTCDMSGEGSYDSRGEISR